MSRQLGQPTPCLLHVHLATAVDRLAEFEAPVGDYDEPYAYGEVHPTVDRPGPFTLREYVRLSLLRSRVQEARGVDLGGQIVPTGTHEQPLSRR